jgi:serine/threonine protein kinase
LDSLRGPLKIPKALSFEAKDLIKRLLCRDPKKRLGAIKDSEEIKEHAFFEGVDWEAVLARKVSMPAVEESPDLPPGDLIKVKFEEEDSHGKVEGWTFIQKKA